MVARARRQSGVAFHRRCSRSARCWRRSAARCSCRASRPISGMDIAAIGDAFVVVVVGGMGSIPGAFLAALLIAEIKALCIALGDVSTPSASTISFPQSHAGCRVRRDGSRAGACAPGDCSASRRRPCARSAEIEAPIAPAGRTLQRIGAALLAGLLRRCHFCRQRRLHARADDRHSDRRAVRAPACISSWGRAACIPSAMPLISASARTARRFCSRTPALPMEFALMLAPLVGGAWRTAVRLVLRAAVRRLPRDADARFRADRLVDRLPMGRVHRRQQRHYRRVAGRMARDNSRVLLSRRWRFASPACCCCAACCSRRSVMRCGRCATRRFVPTRSASTCSARAMDRPSSSPGRSRHWPAGFLLFRKAASRRRRSRSAARSTGS